tara:strand:- start:16876 stop:17262 length:387 start_codon:yes stop_codon:yes gene_type:complete
MSNANGKSCLTSEISKVLAQPKRKVSPRLRPVLVRNAKAKVVESDYGDKVSIVSLIQYQDVKSKKWWPRQFRLDKPEGKIIKDFIEQEEAEGREVFNGTTLYQVLYCEDEAGFKFWESINRLSTDEAA